MQNVFDQLVIYLKKMNSSSDGSHYDYTNHVEKFLVGNILKHSGMYGIRHIWTNGPVAGDFKWLDQLGEIKFSNKAYVEIFQKNGTVPGWYWKYIQANMKWIIYVTPGPVNGITKWKIRLIDFSEMRKTVDPILSEHGITQYNYVNPKNNNRFSFRYQSLLIDFDTFETDHMYLGYLEPGPVAKSIDATRFTQFPRDLERIESYYKKFMDL